MGYARPCRGFFCDHDCARATLAHNGIEMTKKIDSLEIFAPSEGIRYPLARFAAIVPVEHRCHRIYTQSVYMKSLKPIDGARDEKSLNLGPAEVIDERVPVAVEALARIEMFVERSAVEPREPVSIVREVRRHPVEDDAEPR